MTTRISLALFILFTVVKSSGQTYSTVLTDQEIHNFFYQINNSKNIRIHKLSPYIFSWSSILSFNDTTNQELPLNFLNKASQEYSILKSSFTQGDIEFIRQQYVSLKDTTWDFRQLKKFIVADSIINKEIFKKSLSGKRKIKDNYSYSFSVPLFSLDRKSAIIYQDYFCGALCSTSCIYLYQKSNDGRWRQILSWNCWAS